MNMRRQRCQRRAVLASMLLTVSSPALAVDAQQGRSVPPLPLSAGTIATRVQANPFCEAVLVPIQEPTIALASDRQISPIRLKPIGAAIGLRTIGEPLDAPPSPILVTTPEAAGIRINPLIGSQHHASSEHKLQPVQVLEETECLSPIACVDTKLESVSVPETTEVRAAAPKTESAEEFEPIQFSLSDDGPDQSSVDARSSGESESNSVSKSNSVRERKSSRLGLESIRPIVIEPLFETESPVSQPIGQLPTPVVIPMVGDEVELSPLELGTVAEPLLLVESDRSYSEKASGGKGTSSKRSEPSVAPDVTASVVSIRNRHRPPVAVTPPPLNIERMPVSEDVKLVRPAVKRVDAIALNDGELLAGASKVIAANSSQPLTQPDTTRAVNLYMTKAQVRTLTIGLPIRQVQLRDQAVCQAVTSGSNELKLIGLDNGVTQLVVWAEASDAAEPKVGVFNIHVEDVVDVTGESVGDKTATLNQSIARAFPNCRVSVKQSNGQLVVSGHCDSSDSAAQVIRLVRKTCLIPVVDELRIR